MELVYMGCPLSVIRGLVHSLPCSRVAQIGRKTVRTWISLCREGSMAEASAPWQGGLIVIGQVAVENQGSSVGKSSLSRRTRRVRAARKFLEKFDYQQLVERGGEEEGEHRGAAKAGGGVCPGHERTIYQTLCATVVFLPVQLGF